MRDEHLEKRINAILTKLQLLSEADSASIVANDGGNKKPDSSPPPGARPDRAADQPPPKDRSLFEWYSWHFSQATDDSRRRLLCYLAERDYANYHQRRPQPRGKTGPEDESQSMKRIVEWYEGVSALEVAVLEGTSLQHVQKARRVHKRQANNGLPQSEWAGWDDTQRAIAVTNRANAGQSQSEVASVFGVSKRTIQRYWVKVA